MSAGSDGPSSPDIDVTEFLENTDRVDGVGFPLASGAKWIKAATGLAAGAATAAVLGIQSFASSVIDAGAGIVDGIGTFAASLVTVLGDQATAAIRSAFSFSTNELGVFALPAVIGITLLAFGVISVALEVAD